VEIEGGTVAGGSAASVLTKIDFMKTMRGLGAIRQLLCSETSNCSRIFFTGFFITALLRLIKNILCGFYDDLGSSEDRVGRLCPGAGAGRLEAVDGFAGSSPSSRS
jgi:hypothetical protein